MRHHLNEFALTTRADLPFGWLDLPPGWRAGAFCQAAETVRVMIRSADDFALRDGRAVQAVRIAVNGQLAGLLRQPSGEISV